MPKRLAGRTPQQQGTVQAPRGQGDHDPERRRALRGRVRHEERQEDHRREVQGRVEQAADPSTSRSANLAVHSSPPTTPPGIVSPFPRVPRVNASASLNHCSKYHSQVVLAAPGRMEKKPTSPRTDERQAKASEARGGRLDIHGERDLLFRRGTTEGYAPPPEARRPRRRRRGRAVECRQSSRVERFQRVANGC